MAKSKRPRQPESFTIYHIGPDQDGLAVSAALKGLAPNCSWGQVKKWLLNRHVQVNGNLCLDAARRVKTKDVVKVWEQALAKPIESSDLRLAYWDPYLLVVEKPAGVTSVRHYEERKISTKRRQLQPTLEELLPPVLAKVQHFRWPPLPPKGMNRGRKESKQQFGTQHIQNSKLLPPELQVFPVHRLDRETSGLMLFARTRLAEQKLVSLFKTHSIEREYVGVAIGRVEPQTIRSTLVRDVGNGQRGSSMDSEDATGQEAITHIVSVEHIPSSTNETGYSLIRCKLETGRTHQIRIHLAEAGYMLCGDKLYNRSATGQLMVDRTRAPRQALHSDRLAFKHPFTGEDLEFHMPMPRDLASWYSRLRQADSTSTNHNLATLDAAVNPQGSGDRDVNAEQAPADEEE